MSSFRTDFGSMMDGNLVTGFVPDLGSEFSGTLTSPEAVDAVTVHFTNGTDIDVTITDEDNGVDFVLDNSWTEASSKKFIRRRPYSGSNYKVTFGSERPFVSEIDFQFTEKGLRLISALLTNSIPRHFLEQNSGP